METLKKITFLAGFILLAGGMMAQNQATLQAAFIKSFEAEKQSNYTASINELKTIYKTDSYFVNIRLGWLYYLNKEYSESIKYYNTAIQLKPYAIEARFGCVKPLSAIQSWDKVKEQYLQILKIDPQNTVAAYWLGVIYYNRKDYPGALKLFEKIVNLYPLDYDSCIMLGWTKLKLARPSDAKILFNHCLILRPNDKSALAGLDAIK